MDKATSGGKKVVIVDHIILLFKQSRSGGEEIRGMQYRRCY
jgi:hypothetical protein